MYKTQTLNNVGNDTKTSIKDRELSKKSNPTINNPIIIRKYSNRRLYDVFHSKYISLADIKVLVNKSLPFKVIEVKGGTDITKSVLLQIIHNSEAKGESVLPIDLLLRLAKVYGDQVENMFLPTYLNESLKWFSQQQKDLSNNIEKNFNTDNLFGEFQKMGTEAMQKLIATPYSSYYDKTPTPDSTDRDFDTSKNIEIDTAVINDNHSYKSDVNKLKKEIETLRLKLQNLDRSID